MPPRTLGTAPRMASCPLPDLCLFNSEAFRHWCLPCEPTLVAHCIQRGAEVRRKGTAVRLPDATSGDHCTLMHAGFQEERIQGAQLAMADRI